MTFTVTIILTNVGQPLVSISSNWISSSIQTVKTLCQTVIHHGSFMFGKILMTKKPFLVFILKSSKDDTLPSTLFLKKKKFFWLRYQWSMKHIKDSKIYKTDHHLHNLESKRLMILLHNSGTPSSTSRNFFFFNMRRGLERKGICKEFL